MVLWLNIWSDQNAPLSSSWSFIQRSSWRGANQHWFCSSLLFRDGWTKGREKRGDQLFVFCSHLKASKNPVFRDLQIDLVLDKRPNRTGTKTQTDNNKKKNVPFLLQFINACTIFCGISKTQKVFTLTDPRSKTFEQNSSWKLEGLQRMETLIRTRPVSDERQTRQWASQCL